MGELFRSLAMRARGELPIARPLIGPIYASEPLHAEWQTHSLDAWPDAPARPARARPDPTSPSLVRAVAGGQSQTSSDSDRPSTVAARSLAERAVNRGEPAPARDAAPVPSVARASPAVAASATPTVADPEHDERQRTVGPAVAAPATPTVAAAADRALAPGPPSLMGAHAGETVAPPASRVQPQSAEGIDEMRPPVARHAGSDHGSEAAALTAAHPPAPGAVPAASPGPPTAAPAVPAAAHPAPRAPALAGSLAPGRFTDVSGPATGGSPTAEPPVLLPAWRKPDEAATSADAPRFRPNGDVAEPTIHVRIGRVEVRAAAPQPPRPAPPASEPRGPTVTLDDYIAGRHRTGD